MRRLSQLHRWFIWVVCWTALSALPARPVLGQSGASTHGNLKVIVMFSEVGEEGIHTAENTLARAFERRGYSVVDRDLVRQLVQREAALLQLYDIEGAKQIGSRLGADIVISGRSRSRTTEKTYSSMGGKKVTISQANVGAKAILASTGKILVAENTHARKPFDMTGEIALETATESLAAKLLEGIERFMNRNTIEYRFVVLNVNHTQALALQEALRQQVPGVRQVSEHGFVKDTLELDVSVERDQDQAFKRNLFSGLSGLGVGNFVVLAREGETIYLQRMSDTSITVPSRSSKVPEGVPGQSDEPTRAEPGADSAPRPSGTTIYKPGYGKSWAVVIGINDYQKWPKLAYAISDAEAIVKRLKRFDFDEIITILDDQATQKNILRVLGDELYEKAGREDRVFIFFAGHGQTQDVPNGKIGYIIPVDGDEKNYYSSAISMRQLQELSDRLRAKHIFYAMDSCFSGLLLTIPRGGVADDYRLQTAAPVRQVLTAGDEGELVVEKEGHGLFTKVLLAGLDGGADTNGDGYITVSELYNYTNAGVVQSSRNRQNPQFGRLGSGEGEFVFTVSR